MVEISLEVIQCRLVNICQSTRRNVAEDLNHHQNCYEGKGKGIP